MKSIVLLLPGLFDHSKEKIQGKTPLMAARTPTLDHWAQKGEWLKVPHPSKGPKQVWAELLGLNGERGDLTESALQIYAHKVDFKSNECAFLFEFKVRHESHYASFDPKLLKESELHFLCDELNEAFKDFARWIPTKDSKGVCLFFEPYEKKTDHSSKDPESEISLFLKAPHRMKKIQEIEAFLETHSFNQIRLDFEEPLCNGITFHTPGVPLQAIASPAFYGKFALYTPSLIAKGLSHLLSISHEEIEKKKDFSHFECFLEKIEGRLSQEKHIIIECDDLLESSWSDQLLEKIKRIEFLDRSFFSKLSELAEAKSARLLITPMMYTDQEIDPFVPWLSVHPQRTAGIQSVLSFNEEVTQEIKGTYTIPFLAQQFLR